MKKICKTCDTEKNLDEFHKNSQAKDGRRNYCRDCASRHGEKFRIENPDYNSDYQKKNKSVIVAWRKSNRKKLNADHLAYYYKNKDKIKEINSVRRVRLKNLDNKMPRGWWKQLLSFYGEKCMNPECSKKITKENPLSHDHIIPISLGGEHSLANSQVLCFSCNSSKQDKIIDFRGVDLNNILV